MIDEIMEYNRKFVENKGYEPYLTSKYPDKKLAILTCMDTCLLVLLPAAAGHQKWQMPRSSRMPAASSCTLMAAWCAVCWLALELGVEEVRSLVIPTVVCRAWMDTRC